ncbi:hypothetical protein [Nonomuraea dietziae]|uniref:hypothetical protein n=1 Tax=Nonomuraea dietziae TaxID=65515 RepID=UPI003409CADE
MAGHPRGLRRPLPADRSPTLINRLRARVLDTPLEGGGTLAVLEFLAPLEQARAEEVAQILEDAAVVSDRISGTTYVLDIPYIARESTPEEIQALRDALAASRSPLPR